MSSDLAPKLHYIQIPKVSLGSIRPTFVGLPLDRMGWRNAGDRDASARLVIDPDDETAYFGMGYLQIVRVSRSDAGSTGSTTGSKATPVGGLLELNDSKWRQPPFVIGDAQEKSCLEYARTGITVLDAATGLIKASYKKDGGADLLVIDGTTVYASNYGCAARYDNLANLSNSVWERTDLATDTETSAPPYLENSNTPGDPDILYVVMPPADNWIQLFALNAETGETILDLKIPTFPGDQVPEDNHSDYAACYSCSMINGLIIITSSLGIYAVDSVEWQLKWERRYTVNNPDEKTAETRFIFRGPPLLASNEIYAVTQGGICYAFNCWSGDTIWAARQPTGDPKVIPNTTANIHAQPVWLSDTIFYALPIAMVYGVGRHGGQHQVTLDTYRELSSDRHGNDGDNWPFLIARENQLLVAPDIGCVSLYEWNEKGGWTDLLLDDKWRTRPTNSGAGGFAGRAMDADRAYVLTSNGSRTGTLTCFSRKDGRELWSQPGNWANNLALV